MKTYVTNGTKKEGNTMAKTKAELLNEYRDLKKENLKLNNQLEHWKAIARKENDHVVDLAKKLDEMKDELFNKTLIVQGKNEEIIKLSNAMEECEKEKTLIKSQRDVLLKEAEEHRYQINDLQESFDLLQAQVRKIQIDEVVIHDQGYEEGYMDARHSYEKAVAARDDEIDRLVEGNDLLHWVLFQIHENQTK